MTAPTISVLIPTYNYARYLPEAIESALSQDFADFELLIVDDCSSDDSASVIRRYAATDRRIRFLLNRHNRGMVPNWNYCLENARGEYVKFLFGDDAFTGPRTLSTMLALLRARPTATLAACARRVIGEDSREIALWNPLEEEGLHPGREVIARSLLTGQNLVGEPTAVLFRRRDAGPGFNPRYRQWVDLEMWFRLLERGDLVYTSEPLACFRQHHQQQTAFNCRQGVAEREALDLLRTYCFKPWLDPRRLRPRLFVELYHLRRQRSRRGASLNGMDDWLRVLGRGWYFLYWSRRRVSKPFINLRHNWQKHVIRREPLSLRRPRRRLG